MSYQLTFKIAGKLQSVIIDAETWEHAHATGLSMLARMRYRRPRGHFAMVGVGFCAYMPEVS